MTDPTDNPDEIAPGTDVHPAAQDVDPDDVDHLESVDDVNTNTALVQALGDTPRIRILAVLLDAKHPVTVTKLQQMADIGSRDTVYAHVDGTDDRTGLIEAGLVVDVAAEGENRQLTLPTSDEDKRTEWLDLLDAWTGAYLRDGTRPQ